MAVESLFNSLPAHWEVITLGKVCERTGGDIQTGPFGSQLHASDYVPFGIPSIMPKNIGDNRVVTEGIARITTQDAERLSRYLVRTGDIVYSRRGDVERRALIRAEEDGWLCGTGCLRVRFGNGEINPLYASYYLGHPSVREWIVRHAIGATMPNLNTSILSALPFVVPPPPEQKAIARILSSLDEKIELNQQMNRTLEAIAQAIFKSWFVDFDPIRAKMNGRQPVGMDAATADLFPGSFEDSLMGKIPEGWAVIELSKLCRIGRGASPRPITDPCYLGGAIPWIRIADATKADGPFLFETKEGVTEAGKQKSVFLKKGSLILSNSATCGLPIFIELDGCIHDGWLYFENLKLITNNYLYHVLLNLSEYLVHLADGSVQKNLNTKLVGSQIVLVPSQEILNKFEMMSSSIFNKIRENSRESRTLAVIRNELLSQLFSGKVRTNL